MRYFQVPLITLLVLAVIYMLEPFIYAIDLVETLRTGALTLFQDGIGEGWAILIAAVCGLSAIDYSECMVAIDCLGAATKRSQPMALGRATVS
jgi:hypothetical protein